MSFDDRYRARFRELVEDFKVKALDANKAITTEVTSFTSAVAEISEEAAQESIELVRIFQKQRKGVSGLIVL